MTRGFPATVFLLALLFLAGCPNVEIRPQTDREQVTEPRGQTPEPNSLEARQATALEPSETISPSPQPQDEPAGRTDANSTDDGRNHAHPEDAEATRSAVANEPSTNDVNEPEARKVPDLGPAKPAQVDGAEVSEPNSAEPPAAEPNDAAGQAGALPAPTSFAQEYAKILKTHVREDGWVDYATLDRRRLELKALLMKLDELDPNVYRAWSRDEQLAFWINAYNLKLLEIITRNYPIQSSWWLRLTWPPGDIRHIKGIWTDYRFIVMDEEFTLAEVERQFFHQTFKDPRVYLVIIYAARSGPPLRREPYAGEGLDRQLDDQVKRFLADQQGLRIDRRNKVVHLSALFKPSWRGKEFVDRYGTDKKFKSRDPETRAVLNFIASYLSREDRYFLEVENYTIEYMNFDWRLNDTSPSY